ncbi:MAG: hypothetical protein JJ892_00195 [Balneola sp.]|nr:hypothetical protein [Balneola sp.]MBO6651908.1 hypothetical protein [Balneola sp.]MBO6798664.1 hypothetical protein [Balneola sp.]MBO6871865.1 hypothetical protein [Balneola sp.]
MFISLLFGFQLGYAQPQIEYISENEQVFVNNYENSNLKSLPSFKQFLITTNTTSGSSFYENHLAALRSKIRDRDSNKKKAEVIFKYLHDEVFRQYELNALVEELSENRIYNCVTATSFFVSMAEEFGIPFQIYETPAHVYASILHRDEEIIVELTAPKDGFDFSSNMESLLQTLVDSKLISRDELAEKGAEQLYQEYVAKTIPVSKKQLLAIQYHNDALIKAQNKEFEAAYNQISKAVNLYPNQTFSEAFKYIVAISQSDFTLDASKKYSLISKLTLSSKNDSTLTYSLVNHLGELIEDLLKFEENFDLVNELLIRVQEHVLHDSFIDEKLNEYYIYMYTVFAQNASLKGETLEAKRNIEKALALSPENSRLTTYYISVTSNHATKLSQIGLFETARSIVDELAANYPSGYPIIKEARVQIILDALVSIPLVIENETKLLPELELAYSIQPENIYLKSFSATVFHELAMQQVRRSNYQKAKNLILDGLKYNSSDPTLLSDLDLINEILK